MKTLTARKIIAIFTAASLAFLQAVPAGVAATTNTNTKDLFVGTGVSTSETSATNAPSTPVPVSAAAPSTTIGFLGNTGGIVATDTPVVKSAPKLLPVPLPAIKIPVAVQTYVNDLQARVGDGFKVTVTMQKDSTYLISVADSKVYVKAPTAGLHQMSFVLDAKAQLQTDSLQATYYGANKDVRVDGKLLFESLMQFQNKCFEAICPAIRVQPDPKKALAMMSQINVSSVDNDGAIHFSLANKYYKTYRDAKGNVILEKALPPVVQSYVDALQQKIGGGFKVTATIQADGTYLISVADAKVYAKTPTAGLRAFGFAVSGEGIVQDGSVRAVYYGANGDIKTDGNLLFQSSMQLQNACFKGEICNALVVKPDPQKALVIMTQITVSKVDSDGAIHFMLNGQNYKTYRDAKGNVILEKEIPPAVQAYVDQLKSQYPDFKVTADLQADGSYAIHLMDNKQYLVAPNGSFKGVNFVLQAATACTQGMPGSCQTTYSMDPKTLQVIYYGINGDIKLDGRVFYEGLLQITTDPINLMGHGITFRGVAADGSISFEHKDYIWKIYQDSNGKVILEKGLPVAVQNYADVLQAQLGGGFKVSVVVLTAGDNGAVGYMIHVGDSKIYVKTPTSGLYQMDFGITAAGVLQSDSLRVGYYTNNGNVKVDGKLLYDALSQLQYSLTPIMHPIDPVIRVVPVVKKEAPGTTGIVLLDRLNLVKIDQILALMTRITVSSVDSNGAIHFTKDGINYKAYRDAAGKVILEKELPPAVQAYVDALQQKIGGGFKVTATIQADGTYLISVEDAKIYVKAPTSGLHQISFAVSGEGIVQDGSVQAAYYGANGDIKTDGNLLFQSSMQLQNACFKGEICNALIVKPDPQKALVIMTQITVSKVDSDGAIHFMLNGQNYKTYRDAKGNVILEKEIPPAVQAYVDQLKSQYPDFKVTADLQADGSYAIHLMDNKQYLVAPNGSFKGVNFVLQAATACTQGMPGSCQTSYSMDPKTLQVSYYGANGDIKVDGPLYYEGLLQITTDPINLMGHGITFRGVAADGSISFEHKDYIWKIYQDSNGKVILEKGLPVAVQNYADVLQAQLGDGFIVKPSAWQGGGYTILVTSKTVAPKGLRELRLFLDDAGQLNVHYLLPVYDGATGPVSLNAGQGWILFEAAKLLKPEATEQEVLALMTQVLLIGVNDVTTTSKNFVTFQYQGQAYKAYENDQGIVVLEKELPPAVMDVAKAVFGPLGLTIASGQVVADPGCPAGGADCKTIYEFYDANHKLIGKNEVGGIAAFNDWYLAHADSAGVITFSKIPTLPEGMNFSFAPGVAETVLASARLVTDVYADMADLKTRLGLSQMTVVVQAAQEVTWPDSCLGWLQPYGCLQVMTPGSKVILQVNGVSYEYHSGVLNPYPTKPGLPVKP